MKSGKYKVHGYDTFSHEGWDYPDKFDTLEEAKTFAKSEAGQMTLMYVIDPNGQQVCRYGSY